jgi:hypothetical protein
MDLIVDKNWTYRQAIYNIKTLKNRYEASLTSFSSFDSKYRADFIYSLRHQFYALNLLEWQKDNLWKYMNGDMALNDLIISALRYK